MSGEKRANKAIGKNTIAEFPKRIATFLKENLQSFNKDINKFYRLLLEKNCSNLGRRKRHQLDKPEKIWTLGK